MNNTYQSLFDFFKSTGMSGSMASVLAYLTVCEPAIQSASNIETALHLSKGSVNTALNGLVHTKIVQRNQTTKGGRFLEYELDKLGWERAVAYRLHSLETVIQIADIGLLATPTNERLHAMRTAYARFFSQFHNLAKKSGTCPASVQQDVS